MSGYGDSKRRRASSSRGRSGGREEKRHKKKDKKEKKNRDRDGEERSRRRRRSRTRSKSSEEIDVPLEKAPTSAEAALGRKNSTGAMPDPSKDEKKAAWREEMKKESEPAEESDDDGDNADIPGMEEPEDEDAVEKRLAESRARREALISKWVTRGEGPNGQSLETPETPMVDAESDEELSGDQPPPDEKKDEPVDEESQKMKKDLLSFILQHKADHDSMFEENADEEALKKSAKSTAEGISQTGASADDWDDAEGYYRAKVGEVINGRYLVTEDTCGKGVFSNVVKAKDKSDGSMVAIKVMRCNDMMKKAAEKEIELLERLNKNDRQNKRHCIRLFRHFMYRGHLCLVFECMWDNLRVALKKYTKDKGMSLQAVRAYTRQLLVALRHLHRCQIIHADIKPDNILISAGHNVVKICDLGSGMEMTEVEPTPYLVSRFYRAPEIILGAKYGQPLDVFAIGATLFELFTGKILFPGKSNNDMMRHFMEVKGKLPNKLIKSGMCWKQHFDENMDFRYVDVNRATRKKITRTISDLSAKKSVMDMVMARVGPEKQKSTNPDDMLYVKKAKQFADLIDKMITMDPEKRITANDGLSHIFVAEAGPGSAASKDNKGGAPKK
eukprot:TRINITY_DN16646_c0_g1_i2.p1 TRINITY_DN16646_c0_g1~~TRINITY_DN16646_c0_g1_i2.p1  ORF type:complete len:615 (-),score=166.98 TRINITY_DN16646_c0_g1_i2:135-1979(-)